MQTSASPTHEPSRRPRGAKTWLATWLFWAFATGLLFVVSMEVLQITHAAPRCYGLTELALFWDIAFVHLLLVSAVLYLPLRAALPRLGLSELRAHLAAGAIGGVLFGLLIAASLARLVGFAVWDGTMHSGDFILWCPQPVIDWQSLFVLDSPQYGIDLTPWAVTVAATAVIVALVCGVVAAGLVERLSATAVGGTRDGVGEDSPFSLSWRWSKLFFALPVGIALADLVLRLAGAGSHRYLALVHGPLGLAFVAIEKVGWGPFFSVAAAGAGSLMVSTLTWRLLTPVPPSWTWGHAIMGAVAMCLMLPSVARLAHEVVTALGGTWGRPAWDDPRTWLICALAGFLWGGMSAAILRRRLTSAHTNLCAT